MVPVRHRSAFRRIMADAAAEDTSDVAALRKEVLNVKAKAVAKIKALQEQVRSLEEQLTKQRSPPESASSEEGEKFVKVYRPDHEAAEVSLRLREQELSVREQVVSERERAVNEAAHRPYDKARTWHGVMASLSRVNENLAQVDCACTAANTFRASYAPDT